MTVQTLVIHDASHEEPLSYSVNLCGIRIVTDANMPESEIRLENTAGEILATIKNLAVPC